MGFYRIAGALILAVSGVVGAYWMNRSMSETLRQIECFLGLLRYVKAQVECFALPVSVILARADRQLLRGCGYSEDRPPEHFNELLDKCTLYDRASEGILRDFANEFGKSYREEQGRGCAYYFSLLDDRRAALAAQLPARKRINSALWISGALAIVIVLI